MPPQPTIDDQPEDRPVREYYQQLRVSDPAQREAILDRWQSAPLPPVVARPRISRVRMVAVVVALLALVVVSALWEFRTPGTLYGADDLPARLVLVDSFRMTGWQHVPNPAGVNQPSTKLPFEIAVQRPGRYRHTFNSISQSGDQQTIVTGLRVCDGQYEGMLNDGSKEYLRSPVGTLDAALKTEELAQGYDMLMVLGPPDSNYERVGKDTVKGIICDQYVSNFDSNDLIRLWIDPQSGWPIRIVAETLNAAGKWTPIIEINEIDINSELPDSLFTLSPPEGYVDLISKLKPGPSSDPASSTAEPSSHEVPEISMQSTGGGHCNDQSLEIWHSFLISPDSALIAWKRTMPKATDDGSIDWLNGIELDYQSGKASRPLKHQWVRPPQDKQWLWSIIKTADGQPFDRGMIQMTLHSKGCNLSNSIVPLLFPDDTLDRLLQAADKSQPVPVYSEHLTLKSLRALTTQLK
ncbi:MAG: hypothetical protein U0929_14490 [Planctomycetaceae bacterium]